MDEHGPIGGPEEWNAREGDVVAIHVTTAEEDEVLVHDYDREALVGDARPPLVFTADRTGSFEVELKNDDVLVATLVVES